MKRKLISFFLAAAILSGCNNSADPSQTTTETNSVLDTSKAAETTTTAPATVPSTTTQDPYAETSLINIGINNLPIDEISIFDDGRSVFLYQEIHEGNCEIATGNSIRMLNNELLRVRNSSGVLDYAENSTAEKIIKGVQPDFIHCDDFKSTYWINYNYPVVKFSKVTRKDIDVGSAVLSYRVTHDFSVNAFIRNNGNGCDIIIDPAYMYNLPLLTDRLSCYHFDINGKEIIADTLAIKSKFVSNDIKKVRSSSDNKSLLT